MFTARQTTTSKSGDCGWLQRNTASLEQRYQNHKLVGTLKWFWRIAGGQVWTILRVRNSWIDIVLLGTLTLFWVLAHKCLMLKSLENLPFAFVKGVSYHCEVFLVCTPYMTCTPVRNFSRGLSHTESQLLKQALTSLSISHKWGGKTKQKRQETLVKVITKEHRPTDRLRYNKKNIEYLLLPILYHHLAGVQYNNWEL